MKLHLLKKAQHWFDVTTEHEKCNADLSLSLLCTGFMRDTYTLKQTLQLAEHVQVMDTHINSYKVLVEEKISSEASLDMFINIIVS